MTKSTLNNMVNPEVMGKMISASLPQKIKFSNIAKVDRTLVGQAGDTVTLPKFSYIGDAEDIAEGIAMGTTVLTATTTKGKIKKAGKAIELTDEAVLSGYGDPLGEANKQLSMSIASKIDQDCLDVLYSGTLIYENLSNTISYEEVVKAVDLFEEEADFSTKKVIFIHPKQVTQLRLDPDFRDINKYPLETMMTGTIGEVAGCLVVPSRKVQKVDNYYVNPIVITSNREDVAAAITIYLKRDVSLEVDRDILSKTTVISADEHYTVVLSNESKVVLGKFRG
ncbi:MAG: N4-gp56 family major capsid protein [Lachnospirales bacterium]